MRLVLTANSGFNLLNFRAGLIAALREDGHEIVALVPPSEGDGALRAMGLRVEPLAMDPSSVSLLGEYLLMRRMRGALRRIGPDAVLSWTIKSNVWACLAAEPLGIPAVPNVTGAGAAFEEGGALAAAARLASRRAFRGCAAVLFQNEGNRDMFEALGIVRREQARIVPGSGVDLRRFAPAPLPGDGPSFLMIARLLRDKGVVEYLEAARLLRETHPGAKVRLAGPEGGQGSRRNAIPRAELDALCAASGAAWLGPLEDVRGAIAAADAIVLPSYHEGMPRVILEAAAMGRPAVTTDVPGCRDAIAPGRTGLLCRPRDARDLARAMGRMADMSPGERAAMGAAARDRAQARFDERFVVEAYREVLRDVTRPAARAII